MKNWFTNLEKGKQKIALISGWCVTFILLLLFAAVPSEQEELPPWAYILTIIFIASLVISILFSVWIVKCKDVSKREENKNDYLLRNNSQKINTTNTSFNKTSELNLTENICNTNNNTNISENRTTNNIIYSEKMSSYEYPKNETFVFIDVETATKSNDSICAIGIIVVSCGEAKSQYSLINPGVHITNTSIHGISDEDVIGAPTVDFYWRDFINNIDSNYIIIGHNVSFDISVLQKDLERHGIDFEPSRFVDTMSVAKDIYYRFNTQKGDLKLDTLCSRLNIPLNHHNAESDIAATKLLLETLLIKGERSVTDFVNVKAFAKQEFIINNIKECKADTYWEDIKAGRTPLYFTNWKRTNVNFKPEYDVVELNDLLKTSMMDRENSGIERVSNQVKRIKECISKISGKIYGKGAKSATSYIEFYYMDVEEYSKLKEKGIKILHAIDVVNFIECNQELIDNYILKIKSECEQLALEKEEKERKKELRKEEKRIKEEERLAKASIPPRKVVQMDDFGNIIEVFEKVAIASEKTSINPKCIRDCLNGVQKHAGGYVWKYEDEQ